MKKYMIFVSSLASSMLLKTMTKLATTVDPQKAMDLKGKKLMKDSDLGNKFMRLLLENIVRWSERFPTSNNQTPTKFKLAYNELAKERVVLPSDFKFYSDTREKERRQEPPKEEKRSNTPRNSPTPNFDSRSAEGTVRQSLSKIEAFTYFLEECDNEEQLLSEI